MTTGTIIREVNKILTSPPRFRPPPRRTFKFIGGKKVYTTPSILKERPPTPTVVPRLSLAQRIEQVSRTEYNKIDTALKREYDNVNRVLIPIVRKHVKPSLKHYEFAGAEYAKKHPREAKLIFGSAVLYSKFSRNPLYKFARTKEGSIFANAALRKARTDPTGIVTMFALPAVVRGVTRIAKVIPLAKKAVNSPKAMQAFSAGVGVVYTKNIWDRVNADAFSGKYDESITDTKIKTLPDGSIQTTETILQKPIMRRPTRDEKWDRFSGIFWGELGPMMAGEVGLKAISKARFKKLSVKPVKTKFKRIYRKQKGMAKELIKDESAEVSLLLKKKKKLKIKPKVELVPKLKKKEIIVSVAETRPIVIKKGEVIVLDFSEANRLLKLQKGLKVKTVAKFKPKDQLQIGKLEYKTIKQQIDSIQTTTSKIKVQSMEIQKQKQSLFTSQILLQKSKTKSAIVKYNRQISKTKQRILIITKQRSKLVILLSRKLNKLYNTRIIIRAIVEPKLKIKPKPKVKPKAIIKIVPKVITEPLPEPKPKPKPKIKEVPPPKPKPKPKLKPKPPKVKVIPIKKKPKKPKKVKKKKYVSERYDFERRNPIATLKDLIG